MDTILTTKLEFEQRKEESDLGEERRNLWMKERRRNSQERRERRMDDVAREKRVNLI